MWNLMLYHSRHRAPILNLGPGGIGLFEIGFSRSLKLAESTIDDNTRDQEPNDRPGFLIAAQARDSRRARVALRS